MVYIKIRYPKRKEFTEIKAHLKNEVSSFVKIVMHGKGKAGRKRQRMAK